MDMSALNGMSTEALRQLNQMVVGVLRQRYAQQSWEKARNFSVGQMVQFKDKYGRPVTMRVERINTKTVSGVATNPETGRKTNWRVAPSYLSAVETKPTALAGDKAIF
jgi:23S rRNA-/tRNA-specific pseudouridylate synthase